LPAKEALLYDKLANNVVKCNVCPRRCVIKPGKRGFCRTRENRDGKLYTLIYGEVTSMAVDPIEKKPFFNFWPGSQIFSISTFGCSFTCPWCQNWQISQASREEIATEQVTSERIIELTKRYDCHSIAYTYNEPIIWLEYVIDTGKLAKKEGFQNVLVSNGFITLEALDVMAPYIDAANIDIKGFTEEFYHKYCGATLKGVLDATEAMVKKGIHVELTTLIVPDVNDNPEETRQIAQWVKNKLGPDVPLHFSQFYPMYKMANMQPTPVSTLVKAREIAQNEGLNYVYIGNVPGEKGESTYCPKCKTTLIERYGFEISKWNLTDKMQCPKCNTPIAIKGQREFHETAYPFAV
jgi:pyruvate formate lyase activating enzyme